MAALVGTGRTAGEATPADLAAADPRFEAADLEMLDPQTSLSRRRTPGSGTAESVRDQVEKIRQILSHQRSTSSTRRLETKRVRTGGS